jgi:hypothetical protein
MTSTLPHSQHTQPTLHDLIYERIRGYLNRYPGAWLVWCDPQDAWHALLEQVTADYGIAFVSVAETLLGAIGNLALRRALQERLDKGESFVLHVRAGKEHLGWLWAQALWAEERIELSLRQQLYEWGWRSQQLEMSDDEVIWLARHNLHQPPLLWGGGGLQPKPERLLEMLATDGKVPTDATESGTNPVDTWAKDPILKLTIETYGLPPLDVQDIEGWSRYALVRLLVTQAHDIAPTALSHHQYLIEASKRDKALELLEQWADSVRLSKRLAEQILEADRIATLHSYLGTLTVTAKPFRSYIAERTLLANTCTQLAQLPPHELLTTLDAWTPLFESHAQAFWGDQSLHRHDALQHAQALPWGELARLGKAAHELLEAHPGEWTKPIDAINWYTSQGWRAERAGENILRQAKRTTTEFLDLLQALRSAYRARWEEYMIRWSDLWTAANCPVPPFSSQGEWLLEHLKGAQPTAVLMIDALRYDIAMNLTEQINRQEGVERAYVSPARTALPSVTALGMALALPLKEQELRAAVVNGAWQVYHKNLPLNLSIAAQRREWLRTQFKVSPEAMVRLSDVTKERIPPIALRRLFIFDDAIDKLGHDEELEHFGTDELQQRYAQVIALLHECGWSRILLVTDHGFIHWMGGNEQRVKPPVPDPAYASRRALAYPRETQFEGAQGLAPGGAWRIALASGASCYRTYGQLGYFHGGASLQEWIVPCMSVEWPTKAKLINVAIVGIPHILSLRAKIELEVVRETLNENLARQITVSLKHAGTMQVLLTSQPQFVTPKEDHVFVPVEPVENVEAERGTPLRIEVHDTRTGEPLAEGTTVLMVPIENW